MLIAAYLKTSLIEWPGKISSVIFTPGCNFRCPFCHNPDLVETKDSPRSKIELKPTLVDLEKRKQWVDAVVITGGEPTLQSGIDVFLKSLKKMGFLTMIHTNGTKSQIIDDLLSKKLIDYIAMDLKGDFNNYSRYTQNSSVNDLKEVKKSLGLIVRNKVGYEFRTTLVPGLHQQENLKMLARQIKEILLKYKLDINSCRWFLQQFRPLNTLDKSYLKVKPFSKEEMQIIQSDLKKIIPQTLLRGV